MSYRGDDNSIPDRLSLDYAPTNRATCRSCGGAIAQDSVRLSVKVRSPFHDGFDVQYHHSHCGVPRGSNPDSLKGLQRLRWADQVTLAQRLGWPIDESLPEVQRVKRLNHMVWEAQEAVAGLPKKALREVLELNGRFVSDRTPPPTMTYVIADSLVCGLLPPCPWCKCEALVGEGGRIKCSGYSSGTMKCQCAVDFVDVFGGGGEKPSEELKAAVARTGLLQRTPALERVLKKWTLPADAPVRQLGGTASAAASAPVDDGAESEEETDVPSGLEMAGMVFASVGSTEPRAPELQELVEAHGGEWVSGGVGDGSALTHLVSTEAEVRKAPGKRAAKYTAALEAGVPIVSAAYVLALAGRVASASDSSSASASAAGPSTSAAAVASAASATSAAAASTGGKRAGKRPTAEATASQPADTAALEQLTTLKVADLKVKLEERGLSTSGLKGALLQRLQESMRAELELAGGERAAAAATTEAAPAPKRSRVDDGDGAAVAAVAAGRGSGGGGGGGGGGSGGAALRQRKVMRQYMLDGKEGRKLPTVAAAVARRPAPKPEPPPPTKLSPPAPGSAILRVEPLSNKKAARVYVDANNRVWHALCNQADLSSGVNKFYRMQVLVVGSNYSVFKQWGRVGSNDASVKSGGSGKFRPWQNGHLVHEHGGDLEGALGEFRTKFRELTRDHFEMCEPPSQKPGGYAVALIPGQQGADAATTQRNGVGGVGGGVGGSGGGGGKPARVGCTLPEPVAAFVELIFSHKMMTQQLEEQHIDLEKMPLGSISERQIHLGYEQLARIAELLEKPVGSQAQQAQLLLAATSSFYSTIPHKFDLKETPPVIDSLTALRHKVEMVESLMQISQSQKLSARLGDTDEHPTDAMYKQLGCSLQLASAEEELMVREYAANTHAETHSSYTISVRHVFRAQRQEEVDRHASHLGNRMLLWHGSRLTNWAGILSAGLRIAPPEAPATGYMFGKGVYFADMVSKSANYCSATSASPAAVLLLCDVALGEPYERLQAEYEAAARSKKKKKHSTWGVGQTAPASDGARIVEGEVKVPMGKGVPSEHLEEHLERLKKAEKNADPALLYNEFIVYDVNQIRMRYVVFCELQFV